MNYLSGIELYFTLPLNIHNNRIVIDNDDYKHIVKVMRHSAGDEVYITNGNGQIFQTNLESINKNSAEFIIKNELKFDNKFANIFFCLPKLKSAERFEFALEKSAELGITNFVIFESKRTVAKGIKSERWEKILLAAMKQSLRSFLPSIHLMTLDEIKNAKGKKIIFEQKSDKKISEIKFEKDADYYFLFGPEGGLDKTEIETFTNSELISLAENRLRTETAVVKCASVLSEG